MGVEILSELKRVFRGVKRAGSMGNLKPKSCRECLVPKIREPLCEQETPNKQLYLTCSFDLYTNNFAKLKLSYHSKTVEIPIFVQC